MINCIPRLFPTDYEPATASNFRAATLEERIRGLRARSLGRRAVGVIVQFGGQTPHESFSAAQSCRRQHALAHARSLNLAEDRKRSASCWRSSTYRRLPEPWSRRVEEAVEAAKKLDSRCWFVFICARRPRHGHRLR